jgi:Glyoxalase-like domain
MFGRKNRLHLDFRPDDRDGAVDRLLGLGATRADVGQGEQSWIVLSDPDGSNEASLGPPSLTSIGVDVASGAARGWGGPSRASLGVRDGVCGERQ